MRFMQTINKKDFKEFLITSGKFKGKYISYWKNKLQHIDLMENETTIFGECLYVSRSKKDLKTSEIKNIATIILKHKMLKGE